MAGSFGNFWENKILDHIFGKASYTAPANIFIAVSTTKPADDGTNVTEPVGNGYARKQTAPADWTVSVDGVTKNAVALSFAAATGSWGNLPWFALYDASVAGNFLAWGDMATAQTIGNGQTLRFPANALQVSQS